MCMHLHIIQRFSDRETNVHSVLGIRLYRRDIGGTGTGLLLNNDTYLRTTL